MAALTLVVGGVRSGKSRLAERLVAASPPVTYLATAFAGDAEMGRRIDAHRRRRPEDWRTVEEPWDVPLAVAKVTAGGVLVECLSLWVTNLLVGLPGRDGLEDGEILRRVDELAAAAGQADRKVVLVSSEVGCGLLPPNALARRFADLLGEANQRLAAAADAVYASVAGLPLRLK